MIEKSNCLRLLDLRENIVSKAGKIKYVILQ